MKEEGLTRREFLKGTAAATAVLMAGNELFAQVEEVTTPTGPPVGCGIIGLGPRGRELATTLSRLPSANTVAICDTYEPYLKRVQETAPAAAPCQDYRRVLESNDVQAVFIATPSHLHKDIALAALQSGKHVYCEAPLATTIADCKQIAAAASGSDKIFQVGQQMRANPLHNHVVKFFKTGVLGTPAQVRAQYHKKQSWRRLAPSDEREAEINWRLSKTISTGLAGEVGIHQFDVINWYLDMLPTAVTGFGQIIHWDDGRDVPDTIQCIFDYPKGIRMVYDATLVNSVGGTCEVFQGSDSAIEMREDKSWLFKEADAPMLGWEVYAHKEKVGDETGIALIAGATKYLREGKEAPKETGKDALYYAVESFLSCIHDGKQPLGSIVDAHRAAVVAIKANEAVNNGSKVVFEKDWFDF